jgi:ParB family chromosome partitioning protein
MIEEIEVYKIRVDSEKRIRKHSGKDITKLKKSIQKLGLLHPIIISEDNRLLAGYRRLSAMKELGYKTISAIIKTNLTELDELDIEIEENWRRRNLTPYEMDIALAKRKEIYDKLHPEATKEGSYQKQSRNGKGLFAHNESDLDNLSNSVSENGITKKDKSNRNISRKAERFTKVTAELLNVSERTVQRRVRVGTAIKEHKINKNIVQKYKEGEISHSTIQKIIKKAVKKETLRKAKKNGKNRISKNQKDKEKEKTEYCIDCRKAKASTCPCCGEMVIICDKGYLILKDNNSKACKEFES